MFGDQQQKMPAPRRQVRSSGGATVIELSIPMRRRHLVSSDSDDDSDDDDLTCYICANSFCDSEVCCRALTHLGCCTQAICCGCLLKSCKRCGCKDECDAVISLCPFCREVSPVDALDVFLGTKPPCAECKAGDEPAVASSPVASPAPTIGAAAEPPEVSQPPELPEVSEPSSIDVLDAVLQAAVG